jgi:Na+/H+-dicarboxylate symporter
MCQATTEIKRTSSVGKIGGYTILAYIGTTILAASVGVVTGLAFVPFFTAESNPQDTSTMDGLQQLSVSDTIQNLFFSIFTDNIFQALVGPDILAVIIFAIGFGVVAGKLDISGGEPNYVSIFVAQMTNLFNVWITYVVMLAPIAVAFMIASSVAAATDFAVLFANIGIFTGAILLGLLFHIFVSLPAVFAIIVRSNPYKYLLNLLGPISFAFGCASSAATLPINIDAVQKMVPSTITRFVLSLGATINMDGAAVYFPIAIIFLCTVSGQQALLTPSSIFSLALMSTFGAIGASPVPNAGLVMIVTIWETVFPGQPMPMQFAYVTAIDWLIDRCITSTNVAGDAFVARIVAKLVGVELRNGKEVCGDAASKVAGECEEGVLPSKPFDGEASLKNAAKQSHKESTSGGQLALLPKIQRRFSFPSFSSSKKRSTNSLLVRQVSAASLLEEMV